MEMAYSQEQYSFDLPEEKSKAISRKTLTTQMPFSKNPTKIEVDVVGKNMFFEGDIAVVETPKAKALGIKGDNYRWTNAVVPYKIEQGHPRKELILQAIEHINTKTNVCVIPQSTEVNYVEFVNQDNGCWSYVGMIGGKQLINVSVNCPFGSVVHEICHAIGMWHEHTRPDRDKYVQINWDNISEQNKHNYKTRDADGLELGSYDYQSIMHYGAYGFSINGQPTITCTSTCNIGQREGLSKGDIEAINQMYPTSGCSNNHNSNNNNQTSVKSFEAEVNYILPEKVKQAKITLEINNTRKTLQLTQTGDLRGTLKFSLPQTGMYPYKITMEGVNQDNQSKTYYKTGEAWLESDKKYEISTKTDFGGNILQITLQEDTELPVMAKQGATIYNGTDREIEFEISDDNLDWKKASLASKSGKKYRFGGGKQLFGYVRIATPNKGYVYYQVSLTKEYQIFWNETRLRWDLMQQE
jgi:astacin